MTLGQRLSLLRQNENLTQGELSKLTFISRSRLSLYETDKREPDLQTLKQLASFYRVTTDYLLGHEQTSKENAISQEAYDIYVKLKKIPPENRKAVEILLGIGKEVVENKRAN